MFPDVVMELKCNTAELGSDKAKRHIYVQAQIEKPFQVSEGEKKQFQDQD